MGHDGLGHRAANQYPSYGETYADGTGQLVITNGSFAGYVHLPAITAGKVDPAVLFDGTHTLFRIPLSQGSVIMIR
jgi:hypothetical protein